MRERLTGKPAEIVFTSDFHELATGDLRPGATLLLRYDPQRIVPPAEPYRFGDPDRPVTAHLQFREGAAPVIASLRSEAGILACPDVDVTGQGPMLSANVSVPADAERLAIWFSHTTATGAVLYDSDYGANYRFGFPCREIEVAEATVLRRPEVAADCFNLVISAASAVEDIVVRFVRVGDPGCVPHQVSLQRTNAATTGEQTARWTGAIDVPHGAVVRFKLYYWIGGCRLKDDNAGAYYLAPEAEPERLPPPPPALLEAAAAWR